MYDVLRGLTHVPFYLLVLRIVKRDIMEFSAYVFNGGFLNFCVVWFLFFFGVFRVFGGLSAFSRFLGLLGLNFINYKMTL